MKGCYRCLLSYYNQPDHEQIDRTDPCGPDRCCCGWREARSRSRGQSRMAEQGDWHAAIVRWGLPAPDREPLTVEAPSCPSPGARTWRRLPSERSKPRPEPAAEALGYSVAILPEAPGEAATSRTRRTAWGTRHDGASSRPATWCSRADANGWRCLRRTTRRSASGRSPAPRRTSRVIHPALEREPVRPARFAMPDVDKTATPGRGAAALGGAARSRSGAARGRSARRPGWASSPAPISSCRC